MAGKFIGFVLTTDEPPPAEIVTYTHLANMDFHSNHDREGTGFVVSVKLRGIRYMVLLVLFPLY